MTLWTFNSGIPAAGNDPSVDQPSMLNNNVSTLGLIATDHVTFNTQGPIGPPLGSSGQHLQVTFNGNNVPVVPTNVPTLFVNDHDGAGNALPAGVQQLFFYSGTAAQGQNQNVSTANGSVVLQGGIILKWGTNTLASGGFNATQVFPVAFPNNCFMAIAVSNDSTGNNTVKACYNFTNVLFTVVKSTSGTLSISYIAIGN